MHVHRFSYIWMNISSKLPEQSQQSSASTINPRLFYTQRPGGSDRRVPRKGPFIPFTNLTRSDSTLQKGGETFWWRRCWSVKIKSRSVSVSAERIWQHYWNKSSKQAASETHFPFWVDEPFTLPALAAQPASDSQQKWDCVNRLPAGTSSGSAAGKTDPIHLTAAALTGQSALAPRSQTQKFHNHL